MIHLLSATVERWPVAGAFIISRGAKTDVDVVVCTVGDGTYVGRGEGTAIYYEGETGQQKEDFGAYVAWRTAHFFCDACGFV